MSQFKLDNRTLKLLLAQIALNETFTHTLRSKPERKALPFSLAVERSDADTLFTVTLGSERHSLTLPNNDQALFKLANFIEEIANGPTDASHLNEQQPPLSHAERQYGSFEPEHRQQVFELVHRGGSLNLDLGFDLPIHVAIHRRDSEKRAHSDITAILSIGVKRPRTICIKTHDEAEAYKKIVQSIDHLAAAATPAAHAA